MPETDRRITRKPQQMFLTQLRLARAFEFIRAQHTDPSLDLSKTAAVIQISPCHLSRLFKLCTGFGFAFHVRSIRIATARQLLETTTLSVKEISAAVGYSHTNDLDRNFKAMCGLTPTMYRHVLVAGQESVNDRKNSTHSHVAASANDSLDSRASRRRSPEESL